MEYLKKDYDDEPKHNYPHLQHKSREELLAESTSQQFKSELGKMDNRDRLYALSHILGYRVTETSLPYIASIMYLNPRRYATAIEEFEHIFKDKPIQHESPAIKNVLRKHMPEAFEAKPMGGYDKVKRILNTKINDIETQLEQKASTLKDMLSNSDMSKSLKNFSNILSSTSVSNIPELLGDESNKAINTIGGFVKSLGNDIGEKSKEELKALRDTFNFDKFVKTIEDFIQSTEEYIKNNELDKTILTGLKAYIGVIKEKLAEFKKMVEDKISKDVLLERVYTILHITKLAVLFMVKGQSENININESKKVSELKLTDVSDKLVNMMDKDLNLDLDQATKHEISAAYTGLVKIFNAVKAKVLSMELPTAVADSLKKELTHLENSLIKPLGLKIGTADEMTLGELAVEIKELYKMVRKFAVKISYVSNDLRKDLSKLTLKDVEMGVSRGITKTAKAINDFSIKDTYFKTKDFITSDMRAGNVEHFEINRNKINKVTGKEGGTLSWRNNNPGNLKFVYKGARIDENHNVEKGSTYEKVLAYVRRKYGDDVVALDRSGFVIFRSLDAGEEARKKLLINSYGNKTIREMLSRYAVKSDNNKHNDMYLKTILDAGKKAGIEMDGVKIKDLTNDGFKILLHAMRRFEGYKEGKTIGKAKTIDHKYKNSTDMEGYTGNASSLTIKALDVLSSSKISEVNQRREHLTKLSNNDIIGEGGSMTYEKKLEQVKEHLPFLYQNLGQPYVWGGGKTVEATEMGYKKGYDCSGLSWAFYKRLGIHIPHGANNQYHYKEMQTGKDLKNAKVGDLIFFNFPTKRSKGNPKIMTHVGIYVGDGYMVHSSSSGHGTKLTPVYRDAYYKKYYVGFGHYVSKETSKEATSRIKSITELELGDKDALGKHKSGFSFDNFVNNLKEKGVAGVAESLWSDMKDTKGFTPIKYERRDKRTTEQYNRDLIKQAEYKRTHSEIQIYKDLVKEFSKSDGDIYVKGKGDAKQLLDKEKAPVVNVETPSVEVNVPNDLNKGSEKRLDQVNNNLESLNKQLNEAMEQNKKLLEIIIEQQKATNSNYVNKPYNDPREHTKLDKLNGFNLSRH